MGLFLYMKNLYQRGKNLYAEAVSQWRTWKKLAAPSAFFLLVIYYEEIFLKLYCFYEVTWAGAFFTLVFSIPIALLLGLLCGGVGGRIGHRLLVLCTALLSVWMGSQAIYYRLFKTFLTLFSLTKMAMVAGSFGDMADYDELDPDPHALNPGDAGMSPAGEPLCRTDNASPDAAALGGFGAFCPTAGDAHGAVL